jgi:tetratricopeptide (TPR) repeat protein
MDCPRSTPRDETFREALEHHQGGRLAEAERLYLQILEREPRHFDSLHLLGVAQAQSGRPGDALRHIDAAVEIEPRMPPVLNNRGNILKDLGRLADALASYDAAIATKPDYAEAHANRGHTLLALGRLDDALASYDRAMTIRPGDIEALLGRAGCLMDLRRPVEALAGYDLAIGLAPDYAPAHCLRAGALSAMKRFDEALTSCDRALALAPSYAEVHFIRGNVLLELKRADEALVSFERALASNSSYPEAYGNRGHALRLLGRLEEAVTSYDRAIALKPDYTSARMNRGLANLLLGRFAEGWSDYEWRWPRGESSSGRPDAGAPEWQGEDLAGRRLIVFSEQGLGDIIQFARYLPLVAARSNNVTFVVDKKMVRLLQRVTENVEVVDQALVGQTFDFQSLLLSLPLRFGSDLASIPAAVPYLHAEPKRVQAWRARIGEDGFKIGIAWHARPGAFNAGERSIPLSHFGRLARLPGVRLISLQKQIGLDQLTALPKGVMIELLGEEFDEGPDAFVDTAAVIETLDLVIAADTAVAHVAGALARPIWVALPKVPDWRWLLTRNDSPWYPTARLFRQKHAGDWASVFAEIETALDEARER